MGMLMWTLCSCAARGSSNPIVPEEQLADREHLRMGASANGAAAEEPLPGAALLRMAARVTVSTPHITLRPASSEPAHSAGRCTMGTLAHSGEVVPHRHILTKCGSVRVYTWTAPKHCKCAAVAAATELPAEVDRPQEERKARLRGASTDGFPSVTPTSGGADCMSNACCLNPTGRLNRASQGFS